MPTLPAGWKTGFALAHDDASRLYGSSVEGLHAQALGIGIATVPGGTAAFGLGHRTLLGLGRDLGDLDARVVLTMTPTLALDRLRLVVRARIFGPFSSPKDRAGDGRALQCWSGDDGVAVDAKGRVRTGFRTILFRAQVNADDLALGGRALEMCLHG